MTKNSPLASPTALRPRIWILDDSPGESEVIRRALTATCDAETFTDGAVLIETLARRPLPDLLVLDWQMPGLSGIDVCHFLRSEASTAALPVLMLTAHQRPEDVAEGLTAGANDYVFKPFNSVELTARVLALVRWDVLRKRAELEAAEAHERTQRSLADEQARRALAEGTLSEVQAAEEAARRSELRYRLATRVTRDIIWERDLPRGTLEWSRGIHTVLGYPEGEVSTRLGWWFEHIHPEDRERVAHGLDTAVQGRAEKWQDEYRFQRGDGTWADVVDRGLIVRDGQGRAVQFVGAMQDITERKRQEEETRRRVEFERQLIGIVSHDLRTPLSAISLSAATLQRTPLDARQTRSVERILTASGRASRLIRDLLDFTRARLGAGIPIATRPCDLHGLAQAAVDEVQPGYPERRIELVRAGDGSGTWDPDRISQVLSNLVGNALHYSPPGTPVRVETRNEGDMAVLQVHNQGAPIPPESLSRIFEPLERGVEQMEGNLRSIGLGLFIVRQIVRAHCGDIDVRSSEEEGTTFTVRLPRHVAQACA